MTRFLSCTVDFEVTGEGRLGRGGGVLHQLFSPALLPVPEKRLGVPGVTQRAPSLLWALERQGMQQIWDPVFFRGCWEKQ